MSKPQNFTVKQRKVLVVEDVALIRMMTVDLAVEIGLSVADAGSGPEALAILKQDPEIDVLITDLGLPGMTGRELIEEARQLRPGIKVVVATGYAERDARADGPPGAVYLMKPFDIGQLRRAIESA